jgi:hypothetical protein
MEIKDKVLLGSGMYGDSIQLNQNVAYSPSRVWSQKIDYSAVDEEINPLFLQNQKKVDATRSPSPEYAEIVSKDGPQVTGLEEQHYCHSSTDGNYYSSIAEIDELNPSSQ